jgi:large subunit ribosomal protein L10e
VKARNFRKMKNQPYTRKEYIDGIPGSKVVKFTMGSPDKDFEATLRLISLKEGQIRHNALEAARIAANRYLELNLGLENYVLKIVPYPHHVLREKKRLNVAQADRFQEGMKLAFGTPVGVAARVKRRKNIVKVEVMEGDKEVAEEALKRASHKLPIPSKVVRSNPSTKHVHPHTDGGR